MSDLDTSLDAGVVAPFVPAAGRWRPLGLGDVSIESGFWAQLQELNATTMIEHCDSWLERLGWMGNFDAAVEGRLPQDRRGREFSDSEIYKLLEAMAWEIGRTGDPKLEARFQAIVARVGAAQDPDGYISTMFGRPGQAARYSDMQWGHELYCMGHLIQAGVARARTRGRDDALVRVAVAAADHVCQEFAPGANPGVCGHPEIEVALVELSRLTGDERYRDQAREFLARRGYGVLGDIEFGPSYYQDDVPVRDATVMSGHAVRALYLAAAVADVAADDHDDELLAVVTRQTLSTLARRTYLTGGMGSHHEGESFGEDFELPPDRAYSETCAGVGSVMVNHRLLLSTGDARHADAVERTLFNVVATSPAADGRSFFYANTLHRREPGHPTDADEPSPRAASSLRAPWFAVSCCPTNVTRTVASVAAYLASADDNGVQLHQYAASTLHARVHGEPVVLRVVTDYPHDGRVRVVVEEAPELSWSLALRVPGWARTATLTMRSGQREVSSGYVEIVDLRAGDVVQLDLPVRARWTWADPRVDAVRGQVAVERGPLVMALESVDLGADVSTARVRTDAAPIERDGQVLVPVSLERLPERDWPYGALGQPASAGEVLTPLVPYHRWANRGPSTMRVWMPTAGN